MNILRSSLLCAVSCLVVTAGPALAAQSPTPPPTPPETAPAPAIPSQTPSSLPDAPSAVAHTAPAAIPTGPTVLFDTSMGRLTCQLFDKEAPETTANFIGLATGTKPWTDPATHARVSSKPFYDGTVFHRVIPDFMVQGGDRLGSGLGDAGYYIPDEISPSLRFDVPGRLAMANSGPNTNSSQFFITEQPNPPLNGHYSIFGQCDAHSVVMVSAIARVERNSDDKPNTDVFLNKVTVVPAGQPVPPLPAMPASAATPGTSAQTPKP